MLKMEDGTLRKQLEFPDRAGPAQDYRSTIANCEVTPVEKTLPSTRGILQCLRSCWRITRQGNSMHCMPCVSCLFMT